VLDLHLAHLLLVVLVEQLPQMHFQVVHAGVDAACGKFFDFVGDDVAVDFSVGNVLVSVGVSENAGHFCHLDNGQGLGFSFLLAFLYHFFEDCLHFRDVADASLVLVFCSEFLQHGFFDVLGLIAY